MSAAAGAAAALLLLFCSPASAHETQVVGDLRLTVGWGEEPALTGAPNTIELSVTDLAGAPVTDPAASLTVEIAFGGDRLVRALAPGEVPGTFAARVIPTRAGTYTFRVTGTLRGVAIDLTSTCSDTTFDCVGDVGDIQFPVREPSVGQVEARLDREVARAGRAAAAAASARKLAFGAIAVAVGAVALSGTALRRGGRRG